MTKELEQVKHDLSDVRRINAKLNQEVDKYEVQIGELHEQVLCVTRLMNHKYDHGLVNMVATFQARKILYTITVYNMYTMYQQLHNNKI